MNYDNLFFNKIDAYVIVSEDNCFYFTGMECSNPCVIITPKEKYFITDFRYEYSAREKLKDFEIIITAAKSRINEIIKILKKLGVKTVGIEENISHTEYKEIKSRLNDFTVKGITSNIALLRSVKTEREIELISKAQEITETALQKAAKLIRPGVTEREISAEIIYLMLLNGADKDSFTPIVASGISASMPHYSTGDRKFEKGEFIMIDIGSKYKGYCSDLTRTLPLGTPGKQMQKIYNDVLGAQEYALKNIKAGITTHEADSFAREFLLSRGYDKEFGHSLGHGVGINVHEMPSVCRNGEEILRENMVITVEPGVYVRDLGGVRIEDLVVITKEGVRNLTKYPKELII